MSLALLSEELVLLLPHGHRFENAEIMLADLREDAWVSTSEKTPGARSLRRACATAGFEPDLHYRSDDYDVITGFVRSGPGVALVPALGQVASGSYATATISGLRLRRHVVALFAPTTVNPAVEGAVAVLNASSVETAERPFGVHAD